MNARRARPGRLRSLSTLIAGPARRFRELQASSGIVLLAENAVLWPALRNPLPDEQLDVPVGLADPVLAPLLVNDQRVSLGEVFQPQLPGLPAKRDGKLPTI